MTCISCKSDEAVCCVRFGFKSTLAFFAQSKKIPQLTWELKIINLKSNKKKDQTNRKKIIIDFQATITYNNKKAPEVKELKENVSRRSELLQNLLLLLLLFFP